ncbi:MAG: MBL fold metallo-hydrolase [Ilumatobacteraceae bacterium]
MPATEPQRIAPDTFLIPNLVAAQPGTFVFMNSMVILAEQPVIVDTGAPLFREEWLEKVTSLVDPADVRWVFISHDDGDHIGNLAALLELAPNARVITNFFSNERVYADRPGEMPL